MTFQAIDYIEIYVSDIARAKTFYTAAFDWQFTDYGDGYAVIKDRKGGEMGGITTMGYTADNGGRNGNPLVVLLSQDLEASLAAVQDAGGKITLEPIEFPGGRRFHFADPCGNEMAVWCHA